MATGFHNPAPQAAGASALASANSAGLFWGRLLTGLGALLATSLVLLALVSTPFYMVLIREDGFLEAFSAVFWFLAMISAAAGLALRRGLASRSLLAAAIMCIVFLMCGGEEISWGQRIFGFAGPEKLIAINKQQETNLHNIGSISVFSNLFFLFTLFFFVWLPWKGARQSAGPESRRRFQLPHVGRDAQGVFLMGLLMWLIIGIRFGTLGFLPFSFWGHYTQIDDEAFEFFAAFAFFVWSFLDVVQGNAEPAPVLEAA